ncbi:hypothetical protein AB0O15_37955, partial [Actinoplanes sp. NPDC089786]
LDVFVRGADGALWHKWYNGEWHDWESLGGELTSAPAVAAWGPDRLDVFVRGADGALWHKWYNGEWHDWESLGGELTDDPTAHAPAAEHLEVVAPGPEGKINRIGFLDGHWSPWGVLLNLAEAQNGIRSKTQDADAATPSVDIHVMPSKPLSLTTGVGFCDWQYAECMKRADKIKNEDRRTVRFIICWWEKELCYAESFATSVASWLEGALGSATQWMGEHPWAVFGIAVAAVAAGVVVCVVFPPAAPAVATAFVVAF